MRHITPQESDANNHLQRDTASPRARGETQKIVMTIIAEDIGNILLALSVLVAIIFGMLGWWSNQKAQLRAHTLNLIGNLSVNTDLAAADVAVAKLVRETTTVCAKDVTDDLDAMLMRILDYYEFLSVAYNDGAMEKKTFRHLRGSSMMLLHDVLKQYIIERREIYGDSLYKNFEAVVNEFQERSGCDDR